MTTRPVTVALSALIAASSCATSVSTSARPAVPASSSATPARDGRLAATRRSVAVDRLAGRIEWLPSSHEYGGACIRIRGERVIYVDPASLGEAGPLLPADLVLVTHGHDDHFSPTTLAALRKPTTRIVATAECARQLPPDWDVTVVAPGDRLTVDGIGVEVVPAYSTSSRAHPREAGGVGYVLTVAGTRIYHTGDTSFTPEMAALSAVDVLVADVRGPYQMSPDEVVQAARLLRPALVIPVHWLPAERADAERIRDGVPTGTRVLLPPRAP